MGGRGLGRGPVVFMPKNATIIIAGSGERFLRKGYSHFLGFLRHPPHIPFPVSVSSLGTKVFYHPRNQLSLTFPLDDGHTDRVYLSERVLVNVYVCACVFVHICILDQRLWSWNDKHKDTKNNNKKSGAEWFQSNK